MLSATTFYVVLAIIFGCAAVLAGELGFKHKDYGSLIKFPSLLYMSVFFCFAQFLPLSIRTVLGFWGFIGLSASLLIGLIWRYHFVVRGVNWKR